MTKRDWQTFIKAYIRTRAQGKLLPKGWTIHVTKYPKKKKTNKWEHHSELGGWIRKKGG